MIKYLFLVLVCFFSFTQEAGATAYYIDFTNGSDAAAGTATTTAWQSLDKFTEAARTAGDIAFVRRGQASTTNVSDLNFTSDGVLNNPITITADYDNLWADFATSSQTYTPIWGSKTMEASATITGVAMGDWIYVAGDCTEVANASTFNDCNFAYEVATTSGTTLTLYLPYKGEQTGAGNSVRVLPDAPIWNVVSGDFQWNFDTDLLWRIKGINIQGTDVNGQIEIDSCAGHEFIDMVLQGNGGTDKGIYVTDDLGRYVLRKSRFLGDFHAIESSNGLGFSKINIKDSLLDGTGSSFGAGIYTAEADVISMEDTEIKNYYEAVTNELATDFFSSVVYGRGNIFTIVNSSNHSTEYFFEDFNGVIGDNRQFLFQRDTDEQNIQSTTTNQRSGGGLINALIDPATGGEALDHRYEISRLKLFEYPIYTSTSSKTYTVYFNSTSTTNWTTDPTAEEFWIECDYYRSASNAYRGITKSTGVADFNGSTDWQPLSVTCQPSQDGILYLRGWYGKPKESGKSNVFYMDTKPIIQ